MSATKATKTTKARRTLDTYQEALRLLRQLHPMTQAPDGAPIALLASFLPPTDEHEQNLALRRLVEDYAREHDTRAAPCVCKLCERARLVLGGTLHQRRLPLEGVEEEGPET